MNIDCEKILNSTTALPSLPAIATQILELARDNEVSIGKIANLVNKDPAIACKVLRMVNSPLYVKPRQVEIVHQAIVIMGLKQTISVALSFSLLAAMQKQSGEGLDYPFFWKRTLLAATAAKALGEFVGIAELEELFLASLLQDIGMLAVDRAVPGFYSGLGQARYEHDALAAYEREHMGMDHAELGSHLLKKWNLPERTWTVVMHSHRPKLLSEQSLYGRFARVVALSGVVADLFVNNESHQAFLKIGHLAYHYLNFDHQNFQRVLERIASLIPEIETLFSASLVPEGATETILEQAREILVGRNLEALQTVDRLQQETKAMDSRFQVIRESASHDPITGVYNRDYLENHLEKVFAAARQTGKPLTLVLVRTEGLRQANDAYGHQAGDQLLRTAAKAINRCMPESSVVARYAGGEFVVVAPGATSEQVRQHSEPLLTAGSCMYAVEGDSRPLEMAYRLAMLTQGEGSDYASHTAMFAALEAVGRQRRDVENGLQKSNSPADMQ